MKKLVLSLLLALSVTFGFAQTKSGFYVGATTRTNEVSVSPLRGYVQAEAGVNGKVGALAVTGLTNSKFETEKIAALGVKAYLNLFTISNLNFKLGAEALKLYKAPKTAGKSAFTGEFALNVPLTHRFDFRASALAFYHRENTKHSDVWKVCEPGVSATLIFRPFGK